MMRVSDFSYSKAFPVHYFDLGSMCCFSELCSNFVNNWFVENFVISLSVCVTVPVV